MPQWLRQDDIISKLISVAGQPSEVKAFQSIGIEKIPESTIKQRTYLTSALTNVSQIITNRLWMKVNNYN